MKAFRQFLRVLHWTTLGVWIALLFYLPPLPAPEEMLPDITTGTPTQTPEPAGELSLEIDAYRYQLQPKYRYDLKGVVVSLYDSDSWFDFAHQDDPGNIRDLCMVWGENVASGIYREVSYKSGEFSCTFTWAPPLDPPFDLDSASNNHILPANESVAEKIRSIIPGDQVRLQGHLTDYRVEDAEGQTLYTRQTSTRRNDRGDRACEIVYVTNVEILRPASRLPQIARSIALWTFLGVLFLRIRLAFMPLREPRATVSS